MTQIFIYQCRPIEIQKTHWWYSWSVIINNNHNNVILSSCLAEEGVRVFYAQASRWKHKCARLSVGFGADNPDLAELPHKSVVAITVRRAESAGGIKCTPYRPVNIVCSSSSVSVFLTSRRRHLFVHSLWCCFCCCVGTKNCVIELSSEYEISSSI